MAHTALPCFEKAAERAGVWGAGAQLNGIDFRGEEKLPELALRFILSFGKCLSLARVARVNLDHFAGFSVAQEKVTEAGKFQFEAIDDLDGDDVVLAVGLFERGGRSLPEG